MPGCCDSGIMEVNEGKRVVDSRFLIITPYPNYPNPIIFADVFLGKGPELVDFEHLCRQFSAHTHTTTRTQYGAFV